MFQRQNRILFIPLFLLVVACGGTPSDTYPETPKLYGPIGAEKAYCSTASSPSPATTVTATAQYAYRPVSRTLGLIGNSTANIRYAEVHIEDSAGNTLQCGETDGSGNISIAIPRTAGTYTLKVFSRADNSHVRASVLDNSTAMAPYSISAQFTLTGSEPTKAVSLTAADYQNNLEGGAFNILDQILKANEFIKNNSACSFCTTFTVAPKVRIFWTPGLSPGAYYQEPTASISFYIGDDEPDYGMASGMYIMGGINGSVCVDTDHFDNSVLIHEYGHFLEKTYAYSDSPGGSHNGNSIIDPRLAWSEGWANFLQGAVRSDSHYVDTKGNSDCSGGTGINVDLDLENITSGQDAVSGSTYVGEGVFREVSVSRALWDTMEAKTGIGNDGYGANVGFPYIWKVFSDSTSGFKSSSVHFRNVGHFNEFMRSLIAANAAGSLTDYDALIANEAQRSDRNEYALPLTPKASCSTFSLTGTPNVDNLAKNNDFYSYYFDGLASHAIVTLKYSGTGTPSDLDLYAWTENYVLGDLSTLVSSSSGFYPESGGAGVETISFNGRPAGYYMIQVSADPNAAGSASTYYLETNSGSERLCP